MSHATGSELIDLKSILKRVGLTKGMAVAELGCGTGYFSILASDEVGSDGRVYAIDILKSALAAVMREVRKRNIKNIVPVWSNIEVFHGARQIQDGSVDVDLVINTLFMSKKHLEFMRESARMLKKGGVLVIVEWKKNGKFGPPAEDRVEPEEIKKVTVGQGLEFVEAFDAGPYHWGQIYRKV